MRFMFIERLIELHHPKKPVRVLDWSTGAPRIVCEDQVFVVGRKSILRSWLPLLPYVEQPLEMRKNSVIERFFQHGLGKNPALGDQATLDGLRVTPMFDVARTGRTSSTGPNTAAPPRGT